MPLVVCETVNGGLLRDAATKKNDERILLQIMDKDCVAIEVTYHRKCYSKYTNFLHKQDKKAGDGGKSLYDAGYEQFCKKVVEELIKNKKVTFMSHLHSKFVKIVQRVERLHARDFRKFRLKERLIHSYPQLVFVTPKQRNVSEIIFAENLCPSDIMQDDYDLDEYDLSGESGYDDDDFLDADTDANEPLVEAHALYHASMLLKGTISDEAQIDYYVAVTEKQKLRIFSLVQDMIFISSNGKKFTPKSLSLAMTMRQLTGSSKVINLLNQFGRCMSKNFALRHETGLAELSISDNGVIPAGVRKNQNIAIAWENDDFLEDTKTGKDTTHVTEGIIIQRDNGEVKTEELSRVNILRSSSLSYVPDQIAPFNLGKRMTVDLRNALEGTGISEKAYEQPQSRAKCGRLCQMWKTGHIPNWTGYNILLCKEKYSTNV